MSPDAKTFAWRQTDSQSQALMFLLMSQGLLPKAIFINFLSDHRKKNDVSSHYQHSLRRAVMKTVIIIRLTTNFKLCIDTNEGIIALDIRIIFKTSATVDW